MTNNSLLICIFIFSIIISGVLGYILGRINNISGNYVSQLKRSQKKHIITNSISDISINDKKFVTDIKTDSFEKKYDNLGDTKKSEDNIKNSVNKLKNMKG